jgi:hypothetical protein
VKYSLRCIFPISFSRTDGGQLYDQVQHFAPFSVNYCNDAFTQQD